MNPTFWLFLGLLVGITLLFGSFPLWVARLKRHLDGVVSFGAGFIFTTALLILVPEALKEASPLWVLAGFLLLYLLEHFMLLHSCIGEDCPTHQFGIAAFIGLTIHAFAAGVALGASAAYSQSLGLLTFLALAFHKAPESFSLTFILIHSGYSNKHIALILPIFSLALPLGALITFYFVQNLAFITYILLAFSAGTFLEVGGADLLPLVHRPGPGRAHRLLGFILGVVLPVILGGLIPHVHP